MLKRILLVGAVALGLSFGAGVFSARQASAELQVLPKNTSKAQLKALMKAQAKALGVDCDYCHKTPDMAAETEKKKIARQMMKLTQQISAQLAAAGVKKQATCNLCHRGAAKPKF